MLKYVCRVYVTYQGNICNGSGNFGLESLHGDYVGLTGATPQFYSVAPYGFDYSFVDEYFVSIDRWGFLPLTS
jgi:hypothetical protein